MSGNRGCFFNTVLFLVIVFVPVLGHILATLMVLEDDHSLTGKILWLAIIWLMPPWVVLGPLLYLLFGQRRRRVTFAQPYSQQQPAYQQQQQPLGEADAHYERAGIFLAQLELDNAAREMQQAIALVEQVMHTLRTPQQWSIFLHQYSEVYVQAAITDVRRNADEQAHRLLRNVAPIIGAADIIQRLKAYEETIQIAGDDITEDEIRANKDLLKRLSLLRKAVK